jgi:hypothetical protein
VRIGAEGATGRESLARYLIRAPFSAEKFTYNAAESAVVYETKRVAEANGSSESFDPLDFLAAVTSHIPDHGGTPRQVLQFLLELRGAKYWIREASAPYAPRSRTVLTRGYWQGELDFTSLRFASCTLCALSPCTAFCWSVEPVFSSGPIESP